jgi:hypothetical protein
MDRSKEVWPALPLEEWQETDKTLHRWMQIVGKVRLMQTPWINHSWHVPFYVTVRGLSTSPIPHQTREFEMEFDFLEHQLVIQASDGAHSRLPLRPQSVAAFYAAVMAELDRMDLHVDIHPTPNEVPDAVPFSKDHAHASYDPDAAQRMWRILVQSERGFREFRARFIGKTSPIHFFWGGFDLALTRFSGRPAPRHPGGIPNFPDWVAREAYTHEVSSAGFWPGGDPHPFPLFYSYAYPEPAGFAEAPVLPEGAFYSKELREFVLPYDVVRTSKTPDATLDSFLQSTYDAAANLGNWDRAALERKPPRVRAVSARR